MPGVGKTTVLNTLISKGFHVENYGNVMLEEALRMKYVNNRDELRDLPIDEQKSVQRVAAERLSKLSDVIVDTHFSIQTKEGYLPGLPPHVLEVMNADLFISLEADPLEVFERRKKDFERKRDKDPLEKIRKHLELNRAYGVAYSAATGSPLLIVMNENEKVDQASKDIESVLGTPKKDET